MTIKKFEDLEFKQHPVCPMGVISQIFFENGYGVSVIRNSFSYGNELGLYELAILKGIKGKYEIYYDSGITDDVIGYLTCSKVSSYMKKVQKLK